MEREGGLPLVMAFYYNSYNSHVMCRVESCFVSSEEVLYKQWAVVAQNELVPFHNKLRFPANFLLRR